jgi:hypothetical protein
MNNDTLIYFGDPVKALDEKGRVGGYLVRFSDDGSQKDLTGEWFTSKTYLGPKDGDGAEALFEHGFPVLPKSAKGVDEKTLKAIEAFADRTFQPLKTKRDAVGVFAETVLNIEDEYEKFLFGRVKAGKIGWSSGAAGHRVIKNKDGEIVRWPIAEGSLTPRPAEPLNKAISLKSYLKSFEDDENTPIVKQGSLCKTLNQRIADMEDNGRTKEDIVKRLAREAMLDPGMVVKSLAGEYRPTSTELKAYARVLEVEYDTLKNLSVGGKTIKDLFEEALSEQEYSRWNLDSVYCGIVCKLVMAASASKLTGTEFDLEGKIKEATDGYAERLKDLAISQAQDYLDSGSDEHFYLRAMVDPSAEDFVNAKNVETEDHVALVVSALRSLTTRFVKNDEARKQAGRRLSETNRQRLSDFRKQALDQLEVCLKLYEATMPKASQEEMRLAQTVHARQQWRLQRGADIDANATASTG